MNQRSDRNTTSRRAALVTARQSRRPSRLGSHAGAAAVPDYLLDKNAGFPGMLIRAWHDATTAPNLSAAVDTLLTLGGHVPADIQLKALRVEEEAALKALFGLSWREPDRHGRHSAGQSDEPPPFLGELGLTTDGRLAVRVPSQGPLAAEEDLVDGVLRVPWSTTVLADYRKELNNALRSLSRSVADCRKWLAATGPRGRDDLLDMLKDAARRTAPFVLYQGHKHYTNFRERNTLVGKTLWPGHPDCALSSLAGLPLAWWSDSDVVLVVCLTLLVRSAGYARIEEVNGTQVTVDHVAALLERTRLAYNRVPVGRKIPPAAGVGIGTLHDLAEALGERRKRFGRKVQLYRDIHGPLMHKVEHIAGPRDAAAEWRERTLCARLTDSLPLAGDTLNELGVSAATAPGWLALSHGGFATGLESLVYETVRAATTTFDAHFAMSRGMRSLPRLMLALREENWAEITQWDLPMYFCCVVPAPEAREHFDDSTMRLADAAWSISARMQYNSWHFIAGNLPKVPEVEARDYFVPPTIPDLAYYSDQHHRGHVATKVRFSIRSPQAVDVLGRTFHGFVDLRLLRCDGEPFDEQDLLAAQRVSGFIARATTLAAALVADGADIEVTAFDPRWHWETITSQAPSEHEHGADLLARTSAGTTATSALTVGGHAH